MANATFIFSLDCEGKWGVADHLGNSVVRSYDNAALEASYRRIVGLFNRYEISATFAFSSCLFLTPDEVGAHPEWFEPSDFEGRDWFGPFKTDFARQNFDGWLCPAALDVVRESGAHEIGSHGFSHIPLGESQISAAQFRREMESIRAAEALRGVKSDTFIFPRNKVGYLSAMLDHGFTGYRPPLPGVIKHTRAAKLARLADEFNIFEQPIEHSIHGIRGEPLAVPPGRYMTVRSGQRRWIPTAAVKAKIGSVLDRTIRTGRVCHIYSHPHNFITGRNQYDLLDTILRAVAERVRAGELTVCTQQAYRDRFYRRPAHDPLPGEATGNGLSTARPPAAAE